VSTPTLNGDASLDIPAGTQTGTVFEIRDAGFPDVRGRGKGDQYVTVRVVTPTKLTPKQRDLLRQFGEECEGQLSGVRGLLEKVKGVFGA
jgi:molecular chaperone DnaJ